MVRHGPVKAPGESSTGRARFVGVVIVVGLNPKEKLDEDSLIMVAALGLAACGGKGKERGHDEQRRRRQRHRGRRKLHDGLGGKDAITAVVKEFVENQVAKDARINAFFANADVPGFEVKLVDQICQATGGPCEYKGKDMKTAHAGMGIKDADFNALVDDLVKALDKYKVGEKEKAELLGALGGMKGDIVTK